MNDQTTKTREKVDAIGNALIAEFNQHVAKIQAENPAYTDERVIFEGWAIGKIAGLHGLTLHLAAKVAALEFANSNKR